MAMLASDNFDRGDGGDLGAVWTVITSNSNFAIVSNKAQPNALNVDCGERYSGLVWPDDQYGACVLTPSTSGGVSSGDEGIGLVLRAGQYPAKTYYRITADATVSTNNIRA